MTRMTDSRVTEGDPTAAVLAHWPALATRPEAQEALLARIASIPQEAPPPAPHVRKAWLWPLRLGAVGVALAAGIALLITPPARQGSVRPPQHDALGVAGAAPAGISDDDAFALVFSSSGSDEWL